MSWIIHLGASVDWGVVHDDEHVHVLQGDGQIVEEVAESDGRHAAVERLVIEHADSRRNCHHQVQVGAARAKNLSHSSVPLSRPTACPSGVETEVGLVYVHQCDSSRGSCTIRHTLLSALIRGKLRSTGASSNFFIVMRAPSNALEMLHKLMSTPFNAPLIWRKVNAGFPSTMSTIRTTTSSVSTTCSARLTPRGLTTGRHC